MSLEVFFNNSKIPLKNLGKSDYKNESESDRVFNDLKSAVEG